MKDRRRESNGSNRGRGLDLPKPESLESIGAGDLEANIAMVQEAAGPGPNRVLGLEVSQAIQNLANSVTLVAGKQTTARIYLNINLPFPIKVTGTLRAQRSSGGAVRIGSTGVLPISGGSPSLNDQRNDLSKSLNFQLPSSVTAAGPCTLALESLSVTIDLPFAQRRVNVPTLGAPNSSQVVNFMASPPLHVRVVGIRYATNGVTHLPTATDYALIRSWLGRAYPVASVVWSQTTVNAPAGFNANAANKVNALLRGIRAVDVSNGTDPRTHYYGLAADGGFFMRGLASGIPSTVASGPTGSNNWGWDFDGSYGDWYTGHELGHTFGRLHAEFCGAGGGGPYPFTNGQLANADNEFVGLDVGDSSNSIPAQALPGVEWHDVMSYCSKQWVSSFTYMGIRDRIVAEDAAAGPAAGAAGVALEAVGDANASMMHVIATVNITQGTGEFAHVVAHPLAQDAVAPPEAAGPPKYAIRVLDADGQILEEVAAPCHIDSCTDEGDDETGTIDVAIQVYGGGAKLELIHDGKVLAEYVRGARPVAAKAVVVKPAAGEGEALESLAVEPGTTVVSWDSGDDALESVGGGSAVTHMVEISIDEGATWRAIGLGLTTAECELDQSLLEGAEEVLVRITSSDGFSSETETQKFNASDL